MVPQSYAREFFRTLQTPRGRTKRSTEPAFRNDPLQILGMAAHEWFIKCLVHFSAKFGVGS